MIVMIFFIGDLTSQSHTFNLSGDGLNTLSGSLG